MLKIVRKIRRFIQFAKNLCYLCDNTAVYKVKYTWRYSNRKKTCKACEKCYSEMFGDIETPENTILYNKFGRPVVHKQYRYKSKGI